MCSRKVREALQKVYELIATFREMRNECSRYQIPIYCVFERIFRILQTHSYIVSFPLDIYLSRGSKSSGELDSITSLSPPWLNRFLSEVFGSICPPTYSLCIFLFMSTPKKIRYHMQQPRKKKTTTFRIKDNLLSIRTTKSDSENFFNYYFWCESAIKQSTSLYNHAQRLSPSTRIRISYIIIFVLPHGTNFPVPPIDFCTYRKRNCLCPLWDNHIYLFIYEFSKASGSSCCVAFCKYERAPDEHVCD